MIQINCRFSQPQLASWAVPISARLLHAGRSSGMTGLGERLHN
jgi:hypothetical protein